MSLERAMNTYGWMTPEQLVWLRDKTKEFPKVVEVGSYMGKSTLALAECSEYVIAVDDWYGPRDIYVAPEERQRSFKDFCINMRDYIESGRVIPLKEDCRKLTVEQLPKRPPFDMAFIDSDHSYECCAADIAFWHPLIRSGGLLCGHDYFEFAGVKKAVDEVFAGRLIETGIYNVWAVIV